VFFEDLCTARGVRPRPSWQSLKLNLAVAGAIGLLLAQPLLHDRQALSGRVGGDQPHFATLERMVAIIWGGVPTPVVAFACAIAAWGVVVLFRRDPRFAIYLVMFAVVPGFVVTFLGPIWVSQGVALLRYQLPLLPLVLFFGTVGAMGIVRTVFRKQAEAAAWTATVVLAAAYLLATPAIAQVATLGPWYGASDYHWDYRYRWMVVKHWMVVNQHDTNYEPPAFYRKLGRMAAGAAPIIEAPYVWVDPPHAYYATYHRQQETMGMLYDLCLEGPRLGEPTHDRRFRFRGFVFLDDVSAVKNTGARYLLLDRRLRHTVGPAYDNELCIARLTRLYGPPVEMDARLAVFDLRPADPPPALQ
jgi:hypothetical protein